MLEDIEERLLELVRTAEQLPERYREKCFEILLQSVLGGEPTLSVKAADPIQVAGKGRERPMTLIELSQEFSPKGGLDNAVLSAYWLEVHQGKTDGYTSSELIDCFGVLRLNYKNPHDPVSRAKKKGLLMDHDSRLLLTQTGLNFAKAKMKRGEGQ